MALPTEIHQRYKTIIDEILSESDLAQITEKRIRNGIQARVEYDITPQKAAIKELILQRFDVFNARQNGQYEPVPSIEVAEPIPVTNGHKHSASDSESEENVSKRKAEDSDVSDVIDRAPPSKKKKQPKEESVDDDAAFAAKLQAEENRVARPTRGAGSRKAGPAKARKQKAASKKKSKVTASDDSEVEQGASPRKVNRNTGFHKPMNLSPAAASFFGSTQLSRPQVTSEVWKYIKSHELQDPGDKRYILCDDNLRALLKQDKVHMFQMTKILSTHMYNPED